MRVRCRRVNGFAGKFDAIAPGKHVLRFELIDPRDGRVITLPLKSNELGTIEVTK
jgi:hypothetical protein